VHRRASVKEFILTVMHTVGDIHSKGVPVAYTIIAEARNQRLFGDRFTTDTAHEAFARVQYIRRRGFQVKITGRTENPLAKTSLRPKELAAGRRRRSQHLAAPRMPVANRNCGAATTSQSSVTVALKRRGLRFALSSASRPSYRWGR
jgi:hypothetical protein